MNLDHAQSFQTIDRDDMLGHIRSLPDQLDTAWRLGMNSEMKEMKPVSRILVAGMGGSAIGADLLAAYLKPYSTVPVIVYRDYGLPAWAKQADTLVVASSHSGNTEETLSAYQEARQHNVPRMVVCTGGRLAELANEDGVNLWQFEHHGQPRSAVGFSFGLLLSLLVRLGLVTGQEKMIQNAVVVMQAQQEKIEIQQPMLNNPAKEMALRFSGKFPVIIGADLLAPVARRWKGQINELAKHWAQAEELPEADHNLLAGCEQPHQLGHETRLIFLSANSEHKRNQLRTRLTCQLMKEKKLDVEIFEADGSDRLSQMWTALHFGDYLAYYMAIAKNTDPTPIDVMIGLKKSLQNVS